MKTNNKIDNKQKIQEISRAHKNLLEEINLDTMMHLLSDAILSMDRSWFYSFPSLLEIEHSHM